MNLHETIKIRTAKRLRALRCMKNKRIATLANAIGVSVKVYQLYEQPKYHIPNERLAKLLEFYGITEEQFNKFDIDTI